LFNRKLREFRFDFQETYLSLTNEYVLETYFSKKNFNVDCYRVESRLRECLTENQARLNKVVNSYLKEISGSLDQTILVMRNKLEDLNREKKQANVQHMELSERLKTIDRQIEQAHEEWERDLARSQKLTIYLQKAFLEQFSSYVNVMNKEEAASEEKWLYHQYLNIMRNQAEGIIQGDF
jgi:septal ring factor EnvC (AmiA/AmiB activator)